MKCNFTIKGIFKIIIIFKIKHKHLSLICKFLIILFYVLCLVFNCTLNLIINNYVLHIIIYYIYIIGGFRINIIINLQPSTKFT